MTQTKSISWVVAEYLLPPPHDVSALLNTSNTATFTNPILCYPYASAKDNISGSYLYQRHTGNTAP